MQLKSNYLLQITETAAPFNVVPLPVGRKWVMESFSNHFKNLNFGKKTIS